MRVAPVRRELLLLLVIVVGLAGAAVAVTTFHGQSSYAASQQAGARLDPRQLAAMLIARQGASGQGSGDAAVRAACSHGVSGPKLNPWKCSVEYANGHLSHYFVEVAADGAYAGTDVAGGRRLTGCCVLGTARSAAAVSR